MNRLVKRWAIVPVKSLQYTKSRLAAVLSPTERAALSQKLLRQTLYTLKQTNHFSSILVTTRDRQVQQIAKEMDVSYFAESTHQQLNGALTEAAAFASNAGATEILILPADLPRLTPIDLDQLIAYRQPASIIICSDTQQQGTNALLLPTATNFRFRFGENSYYLHTANHLDILTFNQHNIQFDLDTPADWHTYCQFELPLLPHQM